MHQKYSLGMNVLFITLVVTTAFATPTPTPHDTYTPAPTISVTETPPLTSTPDISPTPCSVIEAPELFEPADDSRFSYNSVPPQLIWSQIEGADLYQVQLGVDPLFEGANGFLDSETPSIDLSDFIGEELWQTLAFSAYWRVRAVADEQCFSEWSETRDFYKTVLESPRLLYPLNDSRYPAGSTPVSFVWSSVEGSTGIYTLALALDPEFSNPLGAIDIIGTALDLSQNLTQNDWDSLYGTFYWRIATFDSDNNPGPWSETRYLSRAELPAPIVYAPYDQEHFSARGAPPTFSWGEVENAAFYQLQFATEISFEAPAGTIDVHDTQFDFEPFIDDWDVWYRAYGTFFWRVSAVDQMGNHCQWSLPYMFTKNGRLRVVAFGDSITYGDCYLEGPGYLGFLQDMLIDYYGYAEVINEGMPGAKSHHGEVYIQEVLERNNPEYVLIMFGTNDSVDPFGCTYWGEPYGCTVGENLQAVVQAVKAYHAVPLLATIIPTNPEGQFPDPWQLIDNNEKIRNVASAENITLVELYQHFIDYGYIPPLYCDSLHLVREGYEWMALGWFPYMQE